MAHTLKEQIHTVSIILPSGFNDWTCNNGEKLSVAMKIHAGADEKQRINK